jgi:nicotinamidase-related amidase
MLNLLIIDPQNSFCHPKGSLYVNGADQSSLRIAKLLSDNAGAIDNLTISYDFHNSMTISNPLYWVDGNGNHPEPIKTIISIEDVERGKWRTTNPEHQAWGLEYVRRLAENGRYVLCIWPYHCLINTVGATLMPEISEAVHEWELAHVKAPQYLEKGKSIHTEQYSPFEADVAVDGSYGVPKDPSTFKDPSKKTPFLKGKTIVVGQAMDFCVANGVRDLVSYLPEEKVKDIILLEDATDCVNAAGLEHLGDQFLDEMTSKGMQISTTDKVMSLI